MLVVVMVQDLDLLMEHLEQQILVVAAVDLDILEEQSQVPVVPE
jgi:hypothetical protein